MNHSYCRSLISGLVFHNLSQVEQMEEKLVAAKKREELNEEALAKSVEKLEEINLRLANFAN